jgi:hypothetical protein
MRHIRLVTGTWGISIAVLGFNNAVCFSFEQRTSETHRETDFHSAKGMKYPFIDARLDPCERQSGGWLPTRFRQLEPRLLLDEMLFTETDWQH